MERMAPYISNWTLQVYPPEEGGWFVSNPYRFLAPVDHCIVGEAGNNDERCGLHYNTGVLILVCIATGIELFFILWTTIAYRTPTLTTIGDAIADFLKEPDVTTGVDSALPPRRSKHSFGTPRLGIAPWKAEKNVRWFRAVSIRGWCVTYAV